MPHTIKGFIDTKQAEQGKEESYDVAVATAAVSTGPTSPGQLWSPRDKCLVVDQPLASLLVHGFKRFEGRAWSTDFRGNVWIASSKHVPAADYVTVGQAGELVSDLVDWLRLVFYLNGSLAGYSGHVVFKYHGAEEHASCSSMNQFKAAVLLEHAPRILFWDVYVLSTVEHITDLR